MAVAGLHTLYDLADKIAHPRPIEAFVLGFSAASAILIAYLIILMLFRFRSESNPVIKATWLSSRNDAISTTGLALVGLMTRLAPVRWPEYLFDLFIAGLCFQASWAIWRAVGAASDRLSNQGLSCQPPKKRTSTQRRQT